MQTTEGTEKRPERPCNCKLTEYMKIDRLQDVPSLTSQAVDYFHACWSRSLDRSFVEDCILSSLGAASSLPAFYLMHDGKKILGSYALLVNDLTSRQELQPWFACLHVNDEIRNQGKGSMLTEHAVKEAGKMGFQKLYLKTLLEGFYERLGWEYIGMGINPNGMGRKIYSIGL